MRASSSQLPTGYTLVWSGQYENMLRVRERLKVVLPLTLFLIALLLYMNTKSGVKTAIVLLAVPFSLVGAVWLLYALGYNMSIAVWVGMIALMGLDAETGVFMLLFLDLAYDERVRAGTMRTEHDLDGGDRARRGQARAPEDDDGDGGVHGPAADHVVDRHRRRRDEAHRRADGRRARDARSLLELLVYPALYAIWKWRFEMRRGQVVPRPRERTRAQRRPREVAARC